MAGSTAFLMRMKALSVVVLAAMAAPQVYAEDAPIQIAVEGKFPPFNYLDSNGDLQGFDVEIARAICEAMKAKCELVVQEWDQMIPGLMQDQYDAIISSMSMSAERRALVGFSSRYYDSPSSFIAAKDSPITPADANSLQGLRLGVTLATAQEAYAQHFYKDARIVVFGTSPELYQGLANSEVDLILEDKLAAYDWLANTKAGQCCEFRGDDIKDATFFGDGAGIAVRKDDLALLSALESALSTISSDGTYNMINAKYFPFSIR